MRERDARIPRFCVDAPLGAGAHLALPEHIAHHALRVLRLRSGDAVVLFDGRGGEYAACIESIDRDGVTVRVGAHHGIERESPLRITLVQGISSGERMDLTIQKAVELGVHALQPVSTEKSVVRLDAERAAAKLAHWQRVARSACEQCGRNRIPEVRPVTSLAAYCRGARPEAVRLLLSPHGTQRLREAAARPQGKIVLATGPEAGFTAAEEALLAAAGFVSIALGPRVLRTETAAPAALAALNALAGDF